MTSAHVFITKGYQMRKTNRSKRAEAVIDNLFTVAWQNRVEAILENVAASEINETGPAQQRQYSANPSPCSLPADADQMSK